MGNANPKPGSEAQKKELEEARRIATMKRIAQEITRRQLYANTAMNDGKTAQICLLLTNKTFDKNVTYEVLNDFIDISGIKSEDERNKIKETGEWEVTTPGFYNVWYLEDVETKEGDKHIDIIGEGDVDDKLEKDDKVTLRLKNK